MMQTEATEREISRSVVTLGGSLLCLNVNLPSQMHALIKNGTKKRTQIIHRCTREIRLKTPDLISCMIYLLRMF